MKWVNVLVSFLFFCLLWVNFPAQAKVNLMPGNETFSYKNRTVYQMQPGESIRDSILVENLQDTDIQVRLSAHDGIPTDTGDFSIQPETLENKALGDWFDFDAQSVSIPAGRFVKVGYAITVPTEATPGEYGAGISVYQIDSQNPGVNIKQKVAQRIFVKVGKVNNPQTSLKDLKFLTNQEGAGSNIQLQLVGENSGDVFARIEADYELTFASGIVEKGQFNLVAFPGQTHHYNIPIEATYQVGTTQVSVRYTVTPYNSNGPELPGGQLTAEITLANQDLIAMQPDDQVRERLLNPYQTQQRTREFPTVLSLLLAFAISVIAVCALFFRKNMLRFIQKLRTRSSK